MVARLFGSRRVIAQLDSPFGSSDPAEMPRDGGLKIARRDAPHGDKRRGVGVSGKAL